MLDLFAKLPQPDEALRRFSRLDQSVQGVVQANPAQSQDLVRLLGFGDWFSSILSANGDLAMAIATGVASDPKTLKDVRDANICRIAASDLGREPTRESFESTGAALADLADRCVKHALQDDTSLAVIAMGKYGGRELNYASDIDVLFVCQDDQLDQATTAARAIMQQMNGPPVIFRCDADLRPEGRDGPLVRTLGAYEEYWKRWAQAWEFQALIKARFAAGDADLGASFMATAADHLWTPTLPESALEQIRRLKSRNEARMDRERLANRQVKLGRGGIRDVEFALQILQLVHGRHHPELRVASTLGTIDQLVATGLLEATDAASLAEAYVVLRHIEHRLQMLEGHQTHTLPTSEVEREVIARGLGFRDTPKAQALDQFESLWRQTTSTVRSLHETLFYRPLLEAFAAAPTLALDATDSEDRLKALGFERPGLAGKAIASLIEGSDRSAKVLKALLPAMLQWIAQTPEPDQGLVRLRAFAERLKSYPHLVGHLRDRPYSAQLLARALGSSALLSSALEHDPQLVDALSQTHELSADFATSAAVGIVSRYADDEDEALRALRRFVEGERLRVAARSLGAPDPTRPHREIDELTAIADAYLKGVTHMARNKTQAKGAFSVVGMGRLGGREMGFGSDLDVVFVFDADAEPELFEKIATDVMTLGAATPPIYKMDAELRPEGKKGPLARSLGAFVSYWDRWVQPWEFQALLRARHVAGDVQLTEQFLSIASRHIFQPTFGAEQVNEIRKMKARIASERASRRTDGRFDLKVSAGGLSDIEFTIQMLQLRYGYTRPELRTPSTIKALDAATEAGLIDSDDRDTLISTYAILTRFRNRLYLMRGLPTDVMPQGGELAESLARTVGYPRGSRDRVVADYLRATRRASAVCERIFDREAPRT